MPKIPNKYAEISEQKSEIPEITDSELAALLAADLADNKKLSPDQFIYFQNMDPKILQIKEELLGKHSLKTFTLFKNIVCKEFQTDQNIAGRLAIYLPTALLKPTIIYIHRHFLHPSKSQTFKEFTSLNFHPHAKRVIKQIC